MQIKCHGSTSFVKVWLSNAWTGIQLPITRLHLRKNQPAFQQQNL